MTQKSIIGIIAVVLAIGALTVAALSMSSDAPSQSNVNQGSVEEAVQTDMVEIADYGYVPGTISVKKGTKVTWTNRDSVAHTVTTQDGAPANIDSGLFKKDETYSYTFEQVGTYEYYCEPHPYMKGTVIVTN